MFFAYLVAVIETVIAVALIAGFARKLTYIAAILFSLLIWGTAEGFGGPYTSGAADVGTAVIYAVVFAGLLALSYYAGPGPLQRRLLPGAAHCLVVADRRDPSARSRGYDAYLPQRVGRAGARRTIQPAARGLTNALDTKENMLMRRSTKTLTRAAAATAAGLAVAAALAACGSSGPSAGTAGTPAASGAAGAQPGAAYLYYRSMMRRYYGGGSMMGGGAYGWMMGQAGYSWMSGINGVPGWMHGGRLPGFMMGGSADPGRFMGRFWADAPGMRVPPARAAWLGGQQPAGATVNASARTITFHVRDVRLTVLASPSMPAENFRVAGLVNPAITVPAGARVTITLINADTDMAHGLVITASQVARSWMPMMTAQPAFPHAAMWFLGEPTSAGMHAGTITFTAATPGSYRYLCPVPGHARKGMTGLFTVTGTP